jgi:hypothetical protein
MRSLACAAAAAFLTFAGAAHATPVGFTYDIYDVPESSQNWLWGVNDAGQFVGGYYEGGPPPTAFYTRPDSSRQMLSHPFGTRIFAYDINNNGIVVGQTYFTPNSGFMVDTNTNSWTSLNVPGAASGQTIAYGINDTNTVVGSWQDGAGNYRGFTYSGGTYSAFDVPGAYITDPYSINNAGQITGLYIEAPGGPWKSFLYDSGTFTEIKVPGANMNWARGINDHGHIVGMYAAESGETWHNFVYTGADYLTFDLEDVVSGSPLGINNAGLIVGGLTSNEFRGMGFYGMISGDPPPDPVPEPANMALMLLGLFGFATTGRLRRRVIPG